ncbi:aminoacyl-tRNA hydrolase [Anaerorhabdus furcosa]|uniref:Peptidyl-tRNA hydrolase n=1 Tax=Anaerorhabdus furcosa TaxID=118967 RepID=A0A1T4KRX0_9FIRM|nr:aminoacyl-tRNA hydrolase [Anaerorhabdus furcosa]SJZ45100.1 peptidyl-tRNA hydrolase, PTH1 family [Anaerorhabdus furcosa]
MKLIVGLGNPGKEYEHTRHNAGFDVMDELAKLCHTSIDQKKFNALVAQVRVGSEQVILMKPQTYMNASGEAVIQAVNFYKIDPKDILVIHDDLDLPIGKLRLRTQGSSGGQKGMQSIMNHLHTQEIQRIRVGIDKNPLIPVVDYVLGKIPKESRQDYEASLQKAAEAAYMSINHEFSEVMNRHNKS